MKNKIVFYLIIIVLSLIWYQNQISFWMFENEIENWNDIELWIYDTSIWPSSNWYNYIIFWSWETSYDFENTNLTWKYISYNSSSSNSGSLIISCDNWIIIKIKDDNNTWTWNIKSLKLAYWTWWDTDADMTWYINVSCANVWKINSYQDWTDEYALFITNNEKIYWSTWKFKIDNYQDWTNRYNEFVLNNKILHWNSWKFKINNYQDWIDEYAIFITNNKKLYWNSWKFKINSYKKLFASNDISSINFNEIKTNFKWVIITENKNWINIWQIKKNDNNNFVLTYIGSLNWPTDTTWDIFDWNNIPEFLWINWVWNNLYIYLKWKSWLTYKIKLEVPINFDELISWIKKILKILDIKNNIIDDNFINNKFTVKEYKTIDNYIKKKISIWKMKEIKSVIWWKIKKYNIKD